MEKRLIETSLRAKRFIHKTLHIQKINNTRLELATKFKEIFKTVLLTIGLNRA